MIDYDKLKMGDLVYTETEQGLLPKYDGVIATVTEIRGPNEHYTIRGDFLYSNDVLLQFNEVIKIVTKEENPEYFL